MSFVTTTIAWLRAGDSRRTVVFGLEVVEYVECAPYLCWRLALEQLRDGLAGQVNKRFDLQMVGRLSYDEEKRGEEKPSFQ
jgi:hypothetical protein